MFVIRINPDKQKHVPASLPYYLSSAGQWVSQDNCQQFATSELADAAVAEWIRAEELLSKVEVVEI